MTEILFVGGCHGVGKTTLVDYLSKKYNIEKLGEFVKLDSVFFEKREDYRTLAQLLWFGRFLEMLEKVLKHDKVIADRSMYDFIPYTYNPSLKNVLLNEARNLIRLLEELGVEVNVVFLYASVPSLVSRIRKRDRSCKEQEAETAAEVQKEFVQFAIDDNILRIPNRKTEGTEKALLKNFPDFFEQEEEEDEREDDSELLEV